MSRLKLPSSLRNVDGTVLIQQACGGALAGLIVLMRTLSYAILIYQGPLAKYRGEAMSGMLLSSAIAQTIYIVKGNQVMGEVRAQRETET